MTIKIQIGKLLRNNIIKTYRTDAIDHFPFTCNKTILQVTKENQKYNLKVY